MVARDIADSHQYNCEMLLSNGARALRIAPKFYPLIHAVLTALPPDVTEKLMEMEVLFLAVEESIQGLILDLPPTLHAHPITDSNIPDLHTHPGRRILYLSPLLFDKPQEQIRFTIAHEIAHVVLGHTEDWSPNAQHTGTQQEQDADELAKQWGFERPPTVQVP
jgi:IrrE N-terminal-like domain